MRRTGSVSINETQYKAVKAVQAEFGLLEDYLERTLPDGREKALCFTALEDAAMRATRAVSRT